MRTYSTPYSKQATSKQACQKATRVALRGFTLIELLIVIAIIGILAGVALPNYIQYIEKTRRADGQVALMQEIQSLERCKTTRYTYVGCPLTATTSEEGYYQISLGGVTANNFTITATGQNEQANDAECQVMSITSQGIRTPSPDSSRCWAN